MSAVGQLTTQKSTFIWNISDFSRKNNATGDFISSPKFQLTISTKQKCVWQLDLFPFEEEEDVKDYVSLYLTLNPEPSAKQIDEKYYYEFSLLDTKIDNVNVCKCTSIDHFKIVYCSWGWNKFIERKQLLYKKDSLFVKDTLKVSRFIHVKSCESLVYHSQPYESMDSLVRQYHDLFQSKQSSDVTIILGDKEIKAHKNILSTKSKVFSAMLNNNMTESNSHIITTVNIECEIMMEFLLFLYCRNQISHKNAKSHVAVADKYDVDELKNMCEKILWDNVDIKDVCEILRVADLYNCYNLRSDLRHFIITNAEVIKAEAFEELSKTHPKLLKEIATVLQWQKDAKS